ncbi:histone-lysine N-methyltransferase, H3 lysine-9 specific SUVH4 isoform X2 [Amborella trichopoda]|uniref:histone-lysine N-methyltransferase, H3 lysine-9 specific SUVH4 isoform X2 n=1 Tax=Amborella trichopoda TaxID=13333 RepID=UPI0009BEC8F5|nr:histone-lysine N-methyltransferase, H3 lysine-9 specific SUVH4 isoform X2 [Amborella trichopoda]|eukprot:XP_020519918.1 histone-lysine N-methyltransferase, H3 lysine-9 specific SUVH4 isoform X2 [Amborella trichopoda]
MGSDASPTFILNPHVSPKIYSHGSEDLIHEASAATITRTVSVPVKKISQEVFSERRRSARLQKQDENQGPNNARVRKYEMRTIKSKKAKVHEQASEGLRADLVPEAGFVSNGEELAGNTMDMGENGFIGGERFETNLCHQSGMSADARVKDTLKIFNALFLQAVQGEEKRCRRVETTNEPEVANHCKGKSHKSKGKTSSKSTPTKLKKDGGVLRVELKTKAQRPDLKAITKMIETNAILYARKRCGDIPGVDVGHQFFSRAEMVAIGFHSHWLNGIDFMGNEYRTEEQYKSYSFPLAVSIVLSGQYEDDQDNSEDIVYTGQGGNNLLGNKRQIADQEMKRGNLALKHNLEHGVPVRVTRGHKSESSYCGKVYTYDGLYKVVDYWAERGVSGFTIFKYRLKRLEGQPALKTDKVHFAYGQTGRSILDRRGVVCDDISGGQENFPIPATNVVDPPFAPTGFVYHKSLIVAKSVNLPPDAEGCQCIGGCVDFRICACAGLNGSEFPYVRRYGERLVQAKDVVFECGPNCRCGSSCVNRTSQRGLRYRLEVFRTPNKGWAVRSLESIPSGAPICEYTGFLRQTDEIDNELENNYIFEIDCLQTMKGIDGRQRRFGDVSIHSPANLHKIEDKKSEGHPEFCIDAGSTGNVARFINHSCEPNLFVQCVLSSHHDLKLARVMLFASDNIPPLQELTYDYGYALGSVMDADGKIKTMPCYCGASSCRKRLY